MKMEIDEIATISLKDDEYLIIRFPEATPGMRVRRVFESLAKVFPPDYTKRILVYRGEMQLDKVKFAEDEKTRSKGVRTV